MRFTPGISVLARQQHPYLTRAAGAGSIFAAAGNRSKMFGEGGIEIIRDGE